VAFYEGVLGLPVTNRAGNEWAEFQAGAVRLALHGTEEPTAPSSGTVVFRVDDLDEARWSLQQRGVTFDGHESEVPGVARFTTFHDPDGNPVQLIEYLR
jgi:predicted enzyme related to lactoylglutathione lyase